MRRPKVFVPVNGVNYPVTEKAGIVKAVLNGYFGWTKVWADSYPNLARRIKQVKSGGQ